MGGYLTELHRLSETGAISPMLSSLLRQILVKDPVKRLDINEVLAHKCFKIDEEEDVEVIFITRDDANSLELVEEYGYGAYDHHYLSLCSDFVDNVRVTDAYNNDSSLVDSDHFDLLNGSISFYDEIDAQFQRESMAQFDKLFEYVDEYDNEGEDDQQKISIGLSELF